MMRSPAASGADRQRLVAELIVATWNIQFGIEVERAADVIAEHPELSCADLVLCQELDGEGAARLAELLDLHVEYEPACVHPQTGREFGNAVFTRLPATDRRVVPLPHRATVQGTPRLAIGVRTTHDASPLSAWSTHTETPALRRERRIEQFRTVAEAVHRDGTPLLVVGGDFNTVTRRGIATLSSLMANVDDVPGTSPTVGAQRIEPSIDTTLRRAGRPLALDHLFVRGADVLRSGVAAARGASDHDALWAAIEPTVQD